MSKRGSPSPRPKRLDAASNLGGRLHCFLKSQLDENIDRCIPLGDCVSYGASFKLNCGKYGYTVIGKGTTSTLWKEVSREAQVYRILRKTQGSAVPVFFGKIDLTKIYFLHALDKYVTCL